MKQFDKSEKNYSVYAHVFPNGKIYIGSTRQVPLYRWRRGCGYKNCKIMSDAINQFGWDNIQHVVLMENLDNQTAMVVEKELIKKYHTQDPEFGYNTKNGGQFFTDHSEEFIDTLRKRMIGNTFSAGRKMSDSHREALPKANKGHHRPGKKGWHHTDDTKKMLSSIAKKRWENQAYREKVIANLPDVSGKNNPRYGKPVSDETRRKISVANTGRRMPPESRRRQAEKISVPVYALNQSMQIVAEYPSIKKAAGEIGACTTNIGFCCRNHGRTCHGYYWRYKEAFDADRCGQSTATGKA